MIRFAPRDHFIEDHTQRVNIRTPIDTLTLKLLRGHILRSTHTHPGASEVRSRFGIQQDLSDTEVGQHRFARLGNQNVGRFYIPMDDPLLMGIIQGACDRD